MLWYTLFLLKLPNMCHLWAAGCRDFTAPHYSLNSLFGDKVKGQTVSFSHGDVTAASCKQVVRSHRNQAVKEPFSPDITAAAWRPFCASVDPSLCFLSLSHSYLSLGMKRAPAARIGDGMQVSEIPYSGYLLYDKSQRLWIKFLFLF